MFTPKAVSLPIELWDRIDAYLSAYQDAHNDFIPNKSAFLEEAATFFLDSKEAKPAVVAVVEAPADVPADLPALAAGVDLSSPEAWLQGDPVADYADEPEDDNPEELTTYVTNNPGGMVGDLEDLEMLPRNDAEKTMLRMRSVADAMNQDAELVNDADQQALRLKRGTSKKAAKKVAKKKARR